MKYCLARCSNSAGRDPLLLVVVACHYIISFNSVTLLEFLSGWILHVVIYLTPHKGTPKDWVPPPQAREGWGAYWLLVAMAA